MSNDNNVYFIYISLSDLKKRKILSISKIAKIVWRSKLETNKV